MPTHDDFLFLHPKQRFWGAPRIDHDPFGDRTYRGRFALFQDAAHRVLPEYDLAPSELSFCGDEEDTFENEAKLMFFLDGTEGVSLHVFAEDGRKYRLTFHTRSLFDWTGEEHRRARIESVMVWHAALARDTDTMGSAPVPTTNGTYTTETEIVGVPVGVSVTTGIHRVREYGSYADDFAAHRAFANTLARMHVHAASWEPPSNVALPRLDGDYLLGAARYAFSRIDHIELGYVRHWMRRKDYSALIEAAKAVAPELTPDDQPSIPIHGDNSPLEYRTTHGGRPHDLFRAALGHPFFDLGSNAGYSRREIRTFLDAYRSVAPLPPDSERRLDAHYLASTILSLARTWHGRREHPNQVVHISRDLWWRFRRGISILSNDPKR
ncbi:MAG: hypothetical protein O3A46_06320 [Candidatus Poribacteria bacterium]|nr:hypothetical protein [Candidatus Poribacteria bacterium]